MITAAVLVGLVAATAAATYAAQSDGGWNEESPDRYT